MPTVLSSQVSDIIRTALAEREHRTPEDSRAWGKSLRKDTPRSSQATWDPNSSTRTDPLELLKDQEKSRLQDLIPVRHDRMATSPFAFYRGGALTMASDLSLTPSTPIRVQDCGDAHISNFGIFASPERHLVFDINDFDETARGPWEWDVKRLVTSVEICARDRGFTDDQAQEAALACVNAYHRAMEDFSHKGNLDVWYAHSDADSFAAFVDERGTKKDRKVTHETINKARSKDNTRAVKKFTEVVDGKLRIVSDPPIVVPLRDIMQKEFDRASASNEGDSTPAKTSTPHAHAAASSIADNIASKLGLEPEQRAANLIRLILRGYRTSLADDRRALYDTYHGVDIARKVVGVGSVGTRAWICVFEGAGPTDSLVLQIKEAQESVLERYVGKSPFSEHGRRVVEGQRAIQVASDVMLGWTRLPGEDGHTHDYYVRQLWDGKGSIDLTRVNVAQLTNIGRLCGWTLAHAHARTGDRFAIAGYLGSGDTFDQAVVSFAHAYADQNERDYEAFLQARKNGRLV